MRLEPKLPEVKWVGDRFACVFGSERNTLAAASAVGGTQIPQKATYTYQREEFAIYRFIYLCIHLYV